MTEEEIQKTFSEFAEQCKKISNTFEEIAERLNAMHKTTQKRLITEIMKDDQMDGIYES